jgi:hypothetical protein
MKPNCLRVSSIGMLATLVRVVFVSILAVASLLGQPTCLVSYSPAGKPALTASGKAITDLQADAEPVENMAKVKVSFQNATQRALLLEIKNEEGKMLYSKHYPQETAFRAIFDLSQLGDGNYSLKVSTLTKAGFVKQAYRKAFRIRSSATRSITPVEPDADQALPSYQVRR